MGFFSFKLMVALIVANDMNGYILFTFSHLRCDSVAPRPTRRFSSFIFVCCCYCLYVISHSESFENFIQYGIRRWFSFCFFFSPSILMWMYKYVWCHWHLLRTDPPYMVIRFHIDVLHRRLNGWMSFVSLFIPLLADYYFIFLF